MTGVLIRREGHVTTEAEIGVLRPQTKEHLEAPEAGADKEGSSPSASRGSAALPTPVLQSCEKVHLVL